MAKRSSRTAVTPIDQVAGPVSAKWLKSVGIQTREDLQRVGVVDAYVLVKLRERKASLNLLYALQAILDEIDWREVPESVKQRLKYQAAEAMSAATHGSEDSV